MAISLANYAASALGEKTAYIEADGHGELAHWKKPEESGCFHFKGVDYYPDVNHNEIPVILNRGYERVFFDFGDRYLLFRDEILRCDQRIFLLNLNVWQNFAAKRLLTELKEPEWGDITPVYATMAKYGKMSKMIEKEFHIHVVSLVQIADPFCVSGEVFDILHPFLASNDAGKRRRKLKLTRGIK